ncbi:hypothetical protein ASE68_10615 [Agromyces sp. Leaf222]|nr:hypothetical protein ASE68_10615 [Agromyces sp. Leaf222]
MATGEATETTDAEPAGQGRTQGEWDLVALTPTFIKSEHAQYAKAIVKALGDPLVRNIALSGNYGVGKSSILQEVSRLKASEVVELSLSTLAPIDQTDMDESVPRQATTPTNRIQQEIVKQLLYREEPENAVGSRFRRIERFNSGRELLLAGLSALVVTLIFLIAGWGAIITKTLEPLVEIGLWVYPAVFFAAGGAAYLVRWLLHGRIHVKQFSAGPASVTLDEKSVSYFDQYLDEIVYFFETSRHRVVIFEDIDRFNDSHIFETLRSLNTLLNAAPQIKDRPVQFIYAIKDSIFDRIGLELEGRKPDAAAADLDPAQAESVRANRTKFFDLVIPVVPFITHRSARNLTAQILRGINHQVSDDLVDLAGRFVPDMRLLKNVRNEFVVFRGRIFSGDGEELGLSETHLFAMMLYKSTHLSDFEVIRLGKSRLDRLYEVSRSLVVANVPRVERELRAARQDLARAGSAIARAPRLGKRLTERIAMMVRTTGLRQQNASYQYGGSERTQDYFQSAAFWKSFVGEDGSTAVVWHNPVYGGPQISLSRSDVESLVGEALDPEAWKEADEDAAHEKIAVLEEQLKFLRSADMGDLIKRPEFLVDFENQRVPLATVAERLLTRGLAFELVKAGYVDRNFTLYTSTFHGDRVSPAATNFIIHHVERGLMDEHFELEPLDVDAVVRERGEQALADPALYNIALLDRLLATKSPSARIMVNALARFGSDERRFLQSYLASSSHARDLVRRLTARSPRVLAYLIGEAELDDVGRRALVSECLARLSDKPRQRVDESVKRYLFAGYPELPAVASADLTAKAAGRLATLFKEAGISVPDLSPLGARARTEFVRLGIYDMTTDNLQSAVGEGAGLALDQLRVASRDQVYAKALRELPAYLAAIEGRSPSNATAAGFVAVLTEVHEAAPALIENVVATASAESRIADLGMVPEDTWAPLARENRFPATFANVLRYLGHAGGVDTNLAVVLGATDAIREHDGADEDAKRELAVTLISSAAVLDPVLRAKLAESLDLKKYVAANSLPAESSALFGELRARNVISDSAATYAHLAGADWATKEHVLRHSPKFEEWTTPELVSADLGPVLGSSAVSDAAKRDIVKGADSYAPHGGKAGLLQLARLAEAFKIIVSFPLVAQMAANRVPADQVLTLLRPYLNNATAEQLIPVLRALGDEYEKLTYVGREKPKIPNSAAAIALLEALKSKGIVASFDPTQNPIKVNKRHKQL